MEINRADKAVGRRNGDEPSEINEDIGDHVPSVLSMDSSWADWGGCETALDFDLGRLWSLLEMTNNFFFEPVRHLLDELRISISVSKHNMDHSATLGGENSQTAESDQNEK